MHVPTNMARAKQNRKRKCSPHVRAARTCTVRLPRCSGTH